MDLFDYMREQNRPASPLASRLRPEALEEVVGQEHILARDKLLYRAIKADQLGSLIFFGPPGTGKTTIAQVIAKTTAAEFRELNATTSGKKDMEEVVREAKELQACGRKTILFIDEIHRFNKAQQDYLLPFVEDGTVTLIGATTENPYFEVNRALLSRSRIFELKPLSAADIRRLVLRAVTDEKKGMGMYHAVIDDNAADFISDVAGGDARAALNAVELGILTTDPGPDGKIRLTLEVMQECIQRKALGYDKNGDSHYDVISAFIKSMRGSDADAAAYYLARMLESGEDIRFIARRIMICASEDVGNADPMALVVAVNASLAVERIGMPEAGIILTQACTYVACAPKSNAAVLARDRAAELVEETGTLPVPSWLRDIHYEADTSSPGAGESGKHAFATGAGESGKHAFASGAGESGKHAFASGTGEKPAGTAAEGAAGSGAGTPGNSWNGTGGKFVGNGTGYRYAHNYPYHYVEQQYLPDRIREEKIYELTDQGYEKNLKAWLRKIRQAQENGPQGSAGRSG